MGTIGSLREATSGSRLSRNLDLHQCFPPSRDAHHIISIWAPASFQRPHK
jgi:hypothetical protein